MAESSNARVPKGRVVHGARARVAMRGEPVGYMTGVNYRENFNMQPVEALDDLAVVEHEAVSYEVTLSAQRVKLVGSSLKERGLMPTLDNIATYEEFEVTVLDKITGEVIDTIEGVKMAGRNVDIRKGTITIAGLDFVARKVRDSAGLV